MSSSLTFLRRMLGRRFASSRRPMDDVIAALQRDGYRVLRFQAVTAATVKAAIAREPTSSRLVLIALIDDESPIVPSSNVAAVFRTSLGRPRQAREHGLPYVFEPMTPMAPLPRGSLPRLSFCGSVSAHPVRTACLPVVMADSRIHTDCILRTQFWGGKPHDAEVMREFRDNMKRSEFNLCLRGGGNFSMRLYQTLSAGRIPVLIVQDVAQDLAWADSVPWTRTCVIASSVDTVVPAMLEFWSSRDIVEAQRACQRMYEDHFTGRALLDGVYRRLTEIA